MYDINDLREDLAATIRAVRNTETPLDIGRAKAVAELAQTMINSAKVEIDMINAVGRQNMHVTGFIKAARTPDEPAAIEHDKPRQSSRTPVGNNLIGSL